MPTLADWESRIHVEDRAAHEHLMSAAVEHGSGFNADLRIVSPLGEERWALVERMQEKGFELLDVQYVTSHLKTMGASWISRSGLRRCALTLSGRRLIPSCGRFGQSALIKRSGTLFRRCSLSAFGWLPIKPLEVARAR